MVLHQSCLIITGICTKDECFLSWVEHATRTKTNICLNSQFVLMEHRYLPRITNGGYFPAVSLAYKAEEDLNIDAIDQLKVRLSYGSTGNQGINSLESLGVADYNPYIFGNTTVSGSSASSRLRNPNLKWETTTTLNAGIDFGFLSNKFRGTLEYYKANTTDLLLDRQISIIIRI